MGFEYKRLKNILPAQAFLSPFATVESFSWSPDGKTLFFYANDNLYIAHWPELKPEARLSTQPEVRWLAAA